MGLTKSYAGLVVCRFLLGFFEAGFFPGTDSDTTYKAGHADLSRLLISDINVLQAV